MSTGRRAKMPQQLLAELVHSQYRKHCSEEVVALGEWTRGGEADRPVCPDDIPSFRDRVFVTSVGRDSFVCLRVKLALALLNSLPAVVDASAASTVYLSASRRAKSNGTYTGAGGVSSPLPSLYISFGSTRS